MLLVDDHPLFREGLALLDAQGAGTLGFIPRSCISAGLIPAVP